MIKDFARRPSSRLIAYCLTFGVLGVGAPGAEAGSFQRPAVKDRVPTEAQRTRDLADADVDVFIQFRSEPAMRSYAAAADAARATSGVADRSAGSAAGRLQSQRVRAEQAAALPAIRATGARVIYQAHRAVNGIAVRVSARQMPALRALPGVKGVHVMTPKEMGNSTSVPFLGIPSGVWDSLTGVGATGAGIKIGIIDTGIDYQHANFGGTGLLADYQANDRTVISEGGAAAFPTAKVVGGTDFAGDNYTASNLPVPDPDPMDCNGHGSHVAGTAAGFGVTTSGATFTGPFDGTANTSVDALRIGPGTAPDAELYALRVFGCKGSTNLTAQAIDWAMDPNGDDDFSDHLDVINMSLGSNFGSLFDESVEASNAAAAAGVIVVTSAGNAGDVYFVTGAPGGASGAVAVAASTDLIPALSVTAGALTGNKYQVFAAVFGAPVTATGYSGTIVQALDPSDGAGALTTDACSPLTNGAAVTGNVAIVDRGTCGFTVKVKNAQNAGAIGVIIANSAAGVFGAPGGADATVTIPSAMISFADGNTLKANLAGLAGIVAQENQGRTLASFSSRGPRRGWGMKPDVAAPGSNITSTQTGVVCTSDATGTQCTAPFDPSGFSTGSRALTISGTSMAAPHVAGIMATLKQLHPTWTPRQLRALVISTSSGDIFTGLNNTGSQYGPGRVGTGLVDPSHAVRSEVIMGFGPDYNGLSWEDAGDTFGTEIGKAYTATKSITVLNKGTGTHSYNVSYVPVVNNPGIAVSFPATSVNLGPKKTVSLKVTVSSDGPDAVSKTKDATVAATQTSALAGIGTWSREWLGEESGYVVLTPTSGDDPVLRLPLHVAPRPTATLLAKKFAMPLVLTGKDFFNANPALSFLGGEAPVSTFLEWQATSPNEDLGSGDPQIERLLDSADIKEIGIGSDMAAGGNQLFFGVSTWGNWSSPNEVEFRFIIDADRNGTPDFYAFNADTTRSLNITFGSTAWNDSFVTDACTIAGSCQINHDYLNGIDPTGASSQLFNSNVMVLPLVVVGGLNSLTGAPDITGAFNYWVEAYNREGGLVDRAGSQAAPLTYNPLAPGIDINTPGGFGGSPWYFGANGETIPVDFDPAGYQANQSLGVLALHHHNAGPTKTMAGSRSETLPISSWVSVGDASVSEGNSGMPTLSFTVSLNAPAPTAVVVQLATADGTATVADADYTAKAASLSIPAGQTSKVFTVKVKGDTKGCGAGDDGNETLFLNVTGVTGAALADGQGVGTILTDDTVCPTP